MYICTHTLYGQKNGDISLNSGLNWELDPNILSPDLPSRLAFSVSFPGGGDVLMAPYFQ